MIIKSKQTTIKQGYTDSPARNCGNVSMLVRKGSHKQGS